MRMIFARRMSMRERLALEEPAFRTYASAMASWTLAFASARRSWQLSGVSVEVDFWTGAVDAVMSDAITVWEFPVVYFTRVPILSVNYSWNRMGARILINKGTVFGDRRRFGLPPIS